MFDGFEAALQGRREALTTTANGYQGTRGSAPEASADGIHYPGTYLAGCYNRLTSDIGGRPVQDEHMVNIPNWLVLQFRVEGGDWFSPSAAGLLNYRTELDLRHGVLTRQLRFTDPAGRVTAVRQQRFTSMARRHLAVLRTVFTAENWSGQLTVRTGLDGDVVNGNVEEYRLLANRHLLPVHATPADPDTHDPDTVMLEVVTSQSSVRIAQAARTRLPGQPATRRRPVTAGAARVIQDLDLTVTTGQELAVDKVVATVSSHDRAISSPRLAVLAELARTGDVAALLDEHSRAWDSLWDRFALDIDSDSGSRAALNLHLFHVLQTLSPHLLDADAGVPARGLHGEGYRGHIFWDEVLVLPLLTVRMPQLTRALLLYRYRRLDAARAAAHAIGHAGAMFPWQSGSDGREETPAQLFNIRSGTWMPDNSRLQRHVGLAVAYNVWQYHQATADVEFLAGFGAELIVEVARFMVSLTSYDPATDRYSIAGVMGPDEYHDGYPGADRPGLRDNAYTNVMTAWVLTKALETQRVLAGHDGDALCRRLALEPAEMDRWEHVSRRLRVPLHADGVISQFEGYEQLAEFDWDGYRARYGNIGRLDLILAAEGDTTNRYRLAKQADVLMLLHLLSAEELRALLGRLGYPLPGDAVQRTVEFYTARVAHGSTLCRVVHAWVLARADRERSWPWLTDALRADVDDTQGGTTREGIHLAAMAGTVDLVQRGYTGLEIREDALWLNPRLPDQIRQLSFPMTYRGHRVILDVDHHRVRVSLAACAALPIVIVIGGTRRQVRAGQTVQVALHPGGTPDL